MLTSSKSVFGVRVRSSVSIAQPAQARKVCVAAKATVGDAVETKTMDRREMLLASINIPVLASLLNIGAVERPKNIGVQNIGSVKTLSLCPATPNCIATSEEANDQVHFVPAWTYNPEDGRGKKKPAAQEQAMSELVSVIKSLKPDNFEPKIIKQTEDYVYVEYSSPLFGFIDDTEFWFKPGPGSRVEYRSAARLGESDGDANRKRILTIRQELEKKGWKSVGF